MVIESPVPASNAQEIGKAAARAALAAIPFAGGAAVEAFTIATERGYRRRVDEWMRDLTAAINLHVLEPHGLDWAALEANEGFLDAVAHATRSAAQTHDAEKRSALRNAVTNAALESDVRADQTAILLDLLDALTATHLRLLRIFSNPRAWYAATGTPEPDLMMGGRSRVVEDAYQDLARDPTLLTKVVKDLATHGLADLNLNVTMTGQGILEPAINPLGQRLLSFITEPAG